MPWIDKRETLQIHYSIIKSLLGFSRMPKSVTPERVRRNTLVREWGAHILLLIVLGLFLYFRFAKPDETTAPAVIAGTTLDLLEKHVGGERSETLLLALSPACPWCRRSYPFYKTLVELKELSDHPIAIIASVDTSASAVVQQLHLEAAEVFADSVVALPLQAAGISSVPTVIHLDGQGVVQDVWTGFLDETRQGAVPASIGLGASELIP